MFSVCVCACVCVCVRARVCGWTHGWSKLQRQDSDHFAVSGGDSFFRLAKRHGFALLCPEFSKEYFPTRSSYNSGNVFRHEDPSRCTLLPPIEGMWFLHPFSICISSHVINFLEQAQATRGVDIQCNWSCIRLVCGCHRIARDGVISHKYCPLWSASAVCTECCVEAVTHWDLQTMRFHPCLHFFFSTYTRKRASRRTGPLPRACMTLNVCRMTVVYLGAINHAGLKVFWCWF